MPFAPDPALLPIRAQFEREVIAELDRVGPAGFRAQAIINRWLHAGASRATLWRWMRHMKTEGALRPHFVVNGQRAVGVTDDAVKPRFPMEDVPAMELGSTEAIEVQAQPAFAAATVGGTKIQSPPQFSLSGAVGAGTFQVVQNLQNCIEAATKVMANAMRAPNDPRSVRLMIQASEHLRRCAETSIRLHESIWNISSVEEFHRMVIATVAEESPAAAKRIVARLEDLVSRWMTPP